MKRNVIILAMLAMPLIGNAQREVGSWTLTPKVGINIAKGEPQGRVPVPRSAKQQKNGISSRR